MRTLDCFRASLLGGLLFLGAATPAAAQNLFTNPELDSNATGWFLFPSAVFDPAIDFAGSPTSGSIGFSQPVGAFGGPAIANQCISAVVPNATYNVSASVLMS